MAIQAEKRNAVAGFYSGFAQSAGEATGAFSELGVGEPQVAADYGGLTRELLFSVAQESYGGKGNIHVSMRPAKISSLPGGLTSIYYEHVAGDVVRGVGSEKDSCSFQIMFVAKTP